MIRKRRRMIDPFGASLLDMMTCSLGAVMLLMLMKQADGVIESIRLGRDQAFRGEVVQTLSERRETAATWADDALTDYRATGAGALFGIPPAEGSVVLVIDASRSMLGYGDAKFQRQVLAAQSIVRSWSQTTHVAVVAFSDEDHPALDWYELQTADDRHQIANSIATFANERRGDSTDLAGALRRSINLLAQRPRGGTIVLLSDGEHSVADNAGKTERLSADQILQRLADPLANLKRRGGSVTLHAIGLFDYWPAGQPMPDELALHVLRQAVEAGYNRGVSRDELRRARSFDQLVRASSGGRLGATTTAATLRRLATPDITANLGLGETLRRLSEQLGGRAIAYPVKPAMQR